MSKIGERNKWCSAQEKRLFTCSLCPYSNDLRCRLKLHSETVHNKTIGVHECCDISFTSKEALKNHITSCHRHKYECPVCDKTFVSLLTLRNHQNLVHCDYKKIKCIFCKYATQYKACLKKHMELQHGNRPMYTQCGSVFVKNKSLKQDAATLHRKSATSNRYQCDMCDQDFEYPSFLRRHKIMHSKEFKCTVCKYATSRKVILMKHMKKHGLDDKHSSSSSLIDNSIPSSENRECPDAEKQPKGFSGKDSVENECQDPAEPHTEYMARLESSSSFIQKNINDSGNVLGIEVRSDETSSASSAVGVEHPHLQRLSSRQSLPIWTTSSHRLNAIHEEARRLRSQISPSTTLSSILSLLERLLELSASTTIEIRDSVEFEIRSQAIECFDYLWGASKLAVCCWEDIEGSMKSNPSLKAVQYAYGTLPTFIKWQKRKHLEMVEHIILLTVNTVKNCQPQASSTQNERAKRKQL